MSAARTLRQIRAGSRNVAFRDLLKLADALGFHLVRISGSHHILRHRRAGAMLNLQAEKGDAKPYQVKQLLKAIEEHNLSLDGEEDA